jgi:hypothetical protein
LPKAVGRIRHPDLCDAFAARYEILIAKHVGKGQGHLEIGRMPRGEVALSQVIRKPPTVHRGGLSHLVHFPKNV